MNRCELHSDPWEVPACRGCREVRRELYQLGRVPGTPEALSCAAADATAFGQSLAGVGFLRQGLTVALFAQAAGLFAREWKRRRDDAAGEPSADDTPRKPRGDMH